MFYALLISPMVLANSTGNSDNEETTSNSSQQNLVDQPRVTKPTGNGQYSTSYITTNVIMADYTSVHVRVYYPGTSGNVASSGAPHPGIVFAPGAGGDHTDYGSVLRQIASWGYIVTIVGTGGPCNQLAVDIQSDVLDYYEEQNANTSSIFYNKIDTAL